MPYGDTDYYARRPTIAMPPASVLQMGTDRAGNVLGLHPRLARLKTIFNDGRLAVVQRTGYQNSSRSHFQGTDIWGTANPQLAGHRWLGATSTRCRRRSIRSWAGTPARDAAIAHGAHVGVPAITNPRHLQLRQPQHRRRGRIERRRPSRIASHLPADRPHCRL